MKAAESSGELFGKQLAKTFGKNQLNCFIKVSYNLVNCFFNMENILLMAEGNSSTEISTAEQINEEPLKEFLSKTSVWDFYETAKGEYINNSDDEKKSLIISYYNFMNSGINLLFVVWSLLFVVWSFFFV